MMIESIYRENGAKAPSPVPTYNFDGHVLERLCRQTLASAGDQVLLEFLQKAYPDYPIHLARIGHEWYRLGGVVKPDGSRIAHDLNEWAERTLIECGHHFDTLLDYCRENHFLATQHKGVTLYLVAQTGSKAEDFVQIEVDRTQEFAERYVVASTHPPSDIEELIDPFKPKSVEPFAVGTARYTYRRKTEVAPFMVELAKHRADRHPVQRFMDDWNASSAARHAVFCHDWSLRLSRHLGRHGEHIMAVEIVNNRNQELPRFEETVGKKGRGLATLLNRFDTQVGYPFAWFFYLLKGWVPLWVAEAVQRDLSQDYGYLPERDIAVLKNWFDSPYSL